MIMNPDYYTIEQLRLYDMWPLKFLPAYGMIPYLKRAGTNLTGIELGVLKGENAYVLLDSLPNVDFIYGVDDYKPHTDLETVRNEEDMEQYKQIAVENIQPFTEKFCFIEHDFRDKSLFVQAFKPETVDFVLCNTEHTYEGITQQIELWYPTIKKGGHIFITDTNVEDVKRAILDYRASKKIRIPLHMSANNLMFWEKPHA